MATRAEPQSFQDRELFPSFRDCPGEHVWDDRYLVDRGGAGTNRKHWCLLGEIIQADTIIRPRIVAKDHKGDRFVVAFYPDDPNDMPRLLKNFKVGNTIAIFYPLVHQFLDGSIGVRIEDSDEVLIIPLGFKDVIKMNEQVLKYAVGEGTQRKCHGCDDVKENLNTCARCALFNYCDKDCQTKAWTEKEHKKFCKTLSREDIKLMHFLKYETYDASISFA
ncbi:hypothetical protein F5Y00DRAFT_199390 [Daldinia vernicosa]|uniref:uncharacterized protein n=1 Tax=Daldinia vernicosa TaxID=114800 RepID=UPI00200846E9|nr:uncharacterized protein F5Y00DRAFT_199390 [Daldinia vernicosa]KAI0844401.1 hypothetical protein F5Y00DRAFT_199390 [Daldinia vernicosa]